MPDFDLPVLSPEERIDVVNDDLKLIQRKAGLTFGTDAFLLASYIRPAPRERAVELGGGTGAVSLLLAVNRKVSSVIAVEVQPPFADLIARNASLNGLSDRVKPLLADLRDLKPEDVGGEVKLVFANPPYMKIDSGRKNSADEKFVARHEVKGDVGDFCRAASRLLAYGGKFVTVFRPDRLTDLFFALRDAKLEPKRMTMVFADAESEPCAVLCESVKGAGASLRAEPPLVLYENKAGGKTRTRTARLEEIYKTCSFPKINEKCEE